MKKRNGTIVRYDDTDNQWRWENGALVICASDGQPAVRIHPDGRIEMITGEALQILSAELLKEAARLDWFGE